MKNLILSSIIILFLGSCSFSVFNGYRRGNEAESLKPVSWFRTDSGYFLFNTKFDLMKRHFSGLTVIKPLPNMGYRVVFITEVGLKIWDMEFLPDKHVKFHYVMDVMKKNKVLKTLAQDIGLVLMAGLTDENPEILRDRSTNEMVLKFKEKGRRYYYRILASGSRAANARLESGIVKKVNADFYSADGLSIDSLKIAHYHRNLHIKMIVIHEETIHAIE